VILLTRSGMMIASRVQLKAQLGELAKKHLGRPMRGGRAFAVAAVAAMVLALSGTPAARAAGLKNISVDEFRADVTRLQSVVAGCAAAASACNAEAVGDDVLVGELAKGGFEEHWQWLRATLDKAKTAKAEERATLLREADGQLAELAQESAATPNAQQQQSFSRAREEANAVLSRAEFQRGGGPTWWDRTKAQILTWLGRLFEGIEQVGSAAPWLGTLLEWVFFVGAAVGLLFFLLRNVARQRLRISLEDTAFQTSAWDREADDWAQWAEEHAAAGEWREAVHCLYWAAIVSLEARRAWRHNPTRTPREYVRLLKPGSAQQKDLRSLTQIFERVWYGLRETEAAEYAEARAMHERLAASAAEAEGKSSDASETLSAGGVA
jgi:hypothetical protein